MVNLTFSKNAIDMWELRTYVSASGRSEVEEWYERLSDNDRAQFRARRLEYLAQASPMGWKDPHYHTLTGEYANEALGQIRTKIGGVQWRIVGFKGPGRVFTALLVTQESGSKLPKGTAEKAKNRKLVIEKHPERAHVWDY